MIINLIILQWLLKKGVELLPPYEEGPGLFIPGPYLFQGKMLINVLNILKEYIHNLDYESLFEIIFYKNYEYEQKMLYKKIIKKYDMEQIIKHKIIDKNNDIILSLGGDPELPLMHENYVVAFEDTSCIYAAENRFIKPIYVVISKINNKNIEKAVKAVAEYLYESIEIFKKLVSEYFGYEFANHEYVEEPYGGHIHIGLHLNEEVNKFEIKEKLLIMLSVIGIIKYHSWYEQERHYKNYYGNALHYRSKYDDENMIHIEFRNPPWWVWNKYEELTQLVAAIIIAAKGLTEFRINIRMDEII